MIYGIGIDIADTARVEQMQASGMLKSFAAKVLTDAELKVLHQLSPKRQIEYLAGRFSAKESYSKALGTGIGAAVSFKDLEIHDNEKGQPEVTRYPQSDKLRALVSISHTAGLVITQVTLEKRIDD